MIRALSLFSGIGGLDFGFEAAGFQTVAAVDIDSAAMRNLRANRSWNVAELDVTACSAADILKACGIKRSQVDIVIAGPPCQPYSKAAYWRRNGATRLEDPRSRTLDAFLAVIANIKPQAFLLENVPGFAFREKSEGLQHVIAGVDRINRKAGTRYKITSAKLNAADYGVPQLRERVFLVASRDGVEFRARSFHFLEDAPRSLPRCRSAARGV